MMEDDNNNNNNNNIRVELSEDEREWALEIKEAARQNPELEPLSDFMYAQFAIVSLADPDETNLALIMDRIANYQQYLQEHNIRNTYEEACKVLDQTYKELLPGHYLSFSYNCLEECYVTALDVTKFDRVVATDQRKHDIHLAAAYYQYHAQRPDFTGVRNGSIYLVECSGYDWRNKDMFNMHCIRRLAQLENAYPMLLQSMRFYNTGMFANVTLSMAKKLMSPAFQESIQVGCKLDGGITPQCTLDQLFIVPDLETTNERNLNRIKESLRKRYDNERSFKLKYKRNEDGQHTG